MLIIIALALIWVLAIVMTIFNLASDGYRRVPTRPNGEETLPRYR